MKYTKKQWNDVKIYNSWGIMISGSSRVMIVYQSQADWQTPSWRTYTPAHITLQFSVWSEIQETAQERSLSALKRAQDTAGENYGITAWERDVFGGWHPEGTMERAMSAAKAKVA